MVTYEGLVEAYYDCRVHKARTTNCIKFSLDLEGNLLELMESINNRIYRPKRSICFVVTRPKYREVFAADFSDRVIHHYLSLRIEPILERKFNSRTFNCRKGKGTLAGIKQLESDIKECSENYTKDCYVATIDINSFFMSIPKKVVEDITLKLIREEYFGEDKEDLLFIAHTILSHSPEKHCIRRSAEELWNYLPESKSLFTNGEGLGMPIGNLPSQQLANLFLNGIDWAIEQDLGIKYHGRYVDDIYLVHEDPDVILRAIPKIRRMMIDLGLKLSPKKFYMQHFSKGIDFTGAIVKPGRIYPLNRTVTSFHKSIVKLNKCQTKSKIMDVLPSVNSYLGLIKQYNSYAIRYNILNEIEPRLFKWLYIKGNMSVVSLKKQYHPKRRIKDRLNRGQHAPFRLPEPIADFEERPDASKYMNLLAECSYIVLPAVPRL